MALENRDKKALQAAAVAAGIYLLLQFVWFPVWDQWQANRSDLATMENTLLKYRQAAENIGQRGQEAESLEQRLAREESGLLSGSTPALASAELETLVKELTAAQSIAIGSSNFLAARPLTEEYTEVPLGLQLQCRLDQLTSLLASLAEHPKKLSVGRVQIQMSGTEQNLLRVNLTVAGVMRERNAETNQSGGRAGEQAGG